MEKLRDLRTVEPHPRRRDAFIYDIAVKWQGFEKAEDDTREPLENIIEDVPDMVIAFFKSDLNIDVDLDELEKNAIKYNGQTYFIMPKQ